MGLVKTTPPSYDPITAAEAKAHLNIEHSSDDTIIGYYIKAATDWAEAFCNRQFVQATYTWTFDNLSDSILYVPRPPLVSVTSIKYYDDAGTLQTASSTTLYEVSTSGVYGEIRLRYNQTWPSVRGHNEDVSIVYKAGYSETAASVPEAIKTAVKMMVGHLYEHREQTTERALVEIPAGPRALLMPYYVPVVP
jgi:uncharacterized phiE125 gp8 family phage protein